MKPTIYFFLYSWSSVAPQDTDQQIPRTSRTNWILRKPQEVNTGKYAHIIHVELRIRAQATDKSMQKSMNESNRLHTRKQNEFELFASR